jgi:hypothetical protein
MMKSILAFLFWAFTILLFTGSDTLAAPQITTPDQFFPIYNYQNDWLVYNGQYKNYVPYSQEVNDDTRYVSTYVDLVKNRNYFLLLQTQSRSYLFLEGALQKEVQEGTWLILSIDSLYKIYKRDELLFTVYGSAGIGDKTLLLCNQRRTNDSLSLQAGTSGFINIKPISFSPFGSFAVLAMLVMLMLSVWIYNANPMAFTRLINPVEFLRNDPRDPLTKFYKPYSNSIILFVLVAAMLSSFVVIFFAVNKINIFSVSTILSEKANAFQLAGDFFLISGIFFLLYYGKYILMVMIGNMLNLDKLVDTVFIKIVQSSYLFYVAVFLLVFMLTFNGPLWLDSLRPYVLIPFLIFYSLRFVALYIVTTPPGAFINLYLFSYLCVIEIIPLIVGIKFAL